LSGTFNFIMIYEFVSFILIYSCDVLELCVELIKAILKALAPFISLASAKYAILRNFLIMRLSIVSRNVLLLYN
jgi:hypothetical protein